MGVNNFSFPIFLFYESSAKLYSVSRIEIIVSSYFYFLYFMKMSANDALDIPFSTCFD